MEITDIGQFVNYWDRIHARTQRLLELIPEDRLEHKPIDNKFSFGELIRHMAGVERYMFVEIATGGQNQYPGHDHSLAKGYKNLIDYYDNLHAESRSLILALDNTALETKCLTPAGAKLTLWKWLRAMIEHEIHHRGQLYSMLAILEIKTPPLYGLTSEYLLEQAENN